MIIIVIIAFITRIIAWLLEKFFLVFQQIRDARKINGYDSTRN